MGTTRLFQPVILLTHFAKSSRLLFNSSATFCSRPNACSFANKTNCPDPVFGKTSESISAGLNIESCSEIVSQDAFFGINTFFRICCEATGKDSQSPRLFIISLISFRDILALSESVPKPHGILGCSIENSIPSNIGWAVNKRFCTLIASTYGLRFFLEALYIRPSRDAQSTMLLRDKKQG